eukprot:9449157-Heterocapsa_arctica.AAC.1
MESGVRQGCPLSPLLFVLVADLLLRRLRRQFVIPDPKGHALLRAFADDTALVVLNFLNTASSILTTFREYAVMSWLKLSMAKTVLIPFHPCRLDSFRRTVIHDTFPEWKMSLFLTRAHILASFFAPLVTPANVIKPLPSIQKEPPTGQASIWAFTSPFLLTTSLLSRSSPICGNSALLPLNSSRLRTPSSGN